jgi:hypothetical protein
VRRVKAAAVVLGVLPLLFAACLDGPTGSMDRYHDRTITAVLDSGVAPVNRTADQFYFVLVHGSERAQAIRGEGRVAGVCERPWVFDADAGRPTLAYDPSRVRTGPVDPDEVQIVVGVQYLADRVGIAGTERDCSSLVSLRAFEGRAQVREWLRTDLRMDLVVEPQNGFLSYNASVFVPMGKKIHVNLTRVVQTEASTFWVTGDFEVINLGAWPRDALRPARN